MAKVQILSLIVLFTIIGCIAQNNKCFTTPDIKVVQYIKDDGNFFNECKSSLDKTLHGQLISKLNYKGKEYFIQVACFALDLSANVNPPDSFLLETDWNNWRDTQEYRGYTHIQAFDITCANGHLTSYNPRDPDYLDNNNPTSNPNIVLNMNNDPYGYTKGLGSFDSGDTYEKPFNGIKWNPNVDNTCLEVIDRRASRISNLDRLIQFSIILPHTDAPFVFRSVKSTFCCSGSVSITVDHSTFPTIRLYTDGNLVKEVYQSDLGNFIASAGYISSIADLSLPGQGVIAPTSDEPILWKDTMKSNNCGTCPSGALGDNNNCGSCGTKCGTSQTCSSAKCICSSGTLGDSNNCGSCGIKCSTSQTCSNGVCIPLPTSNCPTTIGPIGPSNCGSLVGVTNTLDCQLQGAVWIANKANMITLPCSSIKGDLCGDTTFPDAAYWCKYCNDNNLLGQIDVSCFSTWFNINQSDLCDTFPTCP